MGKQLKLPSEVQAAPGWLPGRHVKDEPAETPHVGPAPARLLRHRFGRHEVRSARERVHVVSARGVEASGGVTGGGVVTRLELRRAEIGQLCDAWDMASVTNEC